PMEGITAGDFTIPTTGETAHDVWYRIYVSVTDSEGATATTFADVLPQKSQITLEASAPGLTLLLDGQNQVAPTTLTGVEGIERTLEAPLTQFRDGRTYHFVRWSDDAPRIRAFATPEDDTTYTAI